MSKAVRLFVFFDNFQRQAYYPIHILIKKNKTLGYLQDEINAKYNIPVKNQHWLFDNLYCFENYILEEIVNRMEKYKNGYIAIMFAMTEEEKSNLSTYYVKYLEDRYQNENLKVRWVEPIEEIFVISEYVDMTESDKMGWNCDKCSFKNKPFMECCFVCGFSRPANYRIPSGFIMKQEDVEYIKQIKEKEKAQLKIAEEKQKKIEMEKMTYSKKLLEIGQKEIILAQEDIECPICGDECALGTGVTLHSCGHQLCRECLKNQIINSELGKITCPIENCIGTIEHKEIRALLNNQEYERYELVCLRLAESQCKHTFHCKTDNCPMWVVNDEKVNNFLCPRCKRNNCISCGAFHEGNTCEEYQNKLQVDVAFQKDHQYLIELINQGNAMRCPHCAVIIRKRGGCPNMTCNNCKRGFKWTGRQDL